MALMLEAISVTHFNQQIQMINQYGLCPETRMHETGVFSNRT